MLKNKKNLAILKMAKMHRKLSFLKKENFFFVREIILYTYFCDVIILNLNNTLYYRQLHYVFPSKNDNISNLIKSLKNPQRKWTIFILY